MIKQERGITLVTLLITIVVMVIVSSAVVYVSLDGFEINNINKMKNDILLLKDKISTYYFKYGILPVLRAGENKIQYTYDLGFEKVSGENSNSKYYIIDLEAMEEGLALNYGEEGYKNPNTSNDVYIISEVTNEIYYVKGVEFDGKMYYSIDKTSGDLADNIPPTKPEIRVISGKKTNDETDEKYVTYVTEVEIEIVPGKDNWSGVDNTTYTIVKDEGTSEETIISKGEIATNYIYKISENGIYTITAQTKDKLNNVSAEAELLIKLNVTILANTGLPGLYNARDELVASWNTLVTTYGMNIGGEFLYPSNGIEVGADESAAPSAPCYILAQEPLNTGVKLIIPDTITYIGKHTFYKLTSLEHIIFSENSQLSLINWNAFQGCRGLKSINLPSSLKKIIEGAFEECTNLREIFLPSNLEYLRKCSISRLHKIKEYKYSR